MVAREQVKPVRLPDGSEIEDEQQRVLPDDVKRALGKLLDPDEEIKAFTQCDLLPSGQFGEAWLFATGRRLGLYHHDSTASGLLRDIPLDQVRKLGRRDGHGGTLVEVQTTDESMLIGRMTPAHLDDLIQVLPEMQKLLPDPGPVEEHFHWRRQKKRSSAVCPKCGNPIPHWAGTCVNCLQKRQLIFRLFHRVTSYWQIIVAGLLMMLLIKAADLVQPWLQARLIDGAIKHSSLHLLYEIIFALVVVSIVSLGIGGLQSYMMSWFGQKVIYDLRAEMYQHIQRLSVAFYDSKQTGWIMDRITSDTTNLQDFLSDALLDFINNTLTIVLIVIIMFAWNWKLAILTILPTPFIAWAASVFMHKGHRLWHRAWRKRSRMSTLLTDVLPGVRVVKSFGAEGREVDRFDNRSQDFMNASVGASRFFAYFGPITGLLTTIGFMTVWAYGGYQAIVTPRVMTVGALVAFIQYLWRFYQPIQSLSGMAQRFERSATAAQRVFEVLDTPPDVEDSDDARAMPPIVGVVEFDNVTFGYEPHNDVLKGVSFTVQPGEMVGLVGPSGAGKSTAINLLCRFYDVLGGAIRIDGIDLRDVTLGSLRDQLGVVLQEPYLFSGTLFDNITYGRPGASSRDVIQAAKAANCHDFILKFPDGYDTVVGERGTRLSGGERQRISIARAILKNPRILILDEATSSVDTETEGQIREALDRLIKGRTTIAIAHRFSTLRNADRLMVLEQGKLVESGSHAELLAQPDGLFRRLSEQQQQLSEIVAVGG